MTVGALVQGLPMVNGQYSGGDFGWLSPFAALCGAALCLGYALLGASWLVSKCEAEIRDTAYRQIPYLAVGVLLLLVVVFFYALAEDFRIMSRWLERPYLFVFPVFGALAAATLAVSARQTMGWTALLYGFDHLCGSVWNPGDLILALHDPLPHYRCRSRCASFQSGVHVLGSGAFHFPAHAALHRHQLLRLSRQGRNHSRRILNIIRLPAER